MAFTAVTMTDLADVASVAARPRGRRLKIPRLATKVQGSNADYRQRLRRLRVLTSRPTSASVDKVLQQRPKAEVSLVTTSIENIDDVAHALRWPPRYVAKWLGMELAAMAVYVVGPGGTACVTLSGEHSAKACQATLERFVDVYILCRECRSPALECTLTADGNLHGTCCACGWAGELGEHIAFAKFIRFCSPDSMRQWGPGTRRWKGDIRSAEKGDRWNDKEDSPEQNERKANKDKEQMMETEQKCKDEDGRQEDEETKKKKKETYKQVHEDKNKRQEFQETEEEHDNHYKTEAKKKDEKDKIEKQEKNEKRERNDDTEKNEKKENNEKKERNEKKEKMEQDDKKETKEKKEKRKKAERKEKNNKKEKKEDTDSSKSEKHRREEDKSEGGDTNDACRTVELEEATLRREWQECIATADAKGEEATEEVLALKGRSKKVEKEIRQRDEHEELRP